MKLNKDYLKKFEVCKKTIYEFQDLCAELEPVYGKGVWALPCKVGVTENKIRRGHKICQEKGIIKLSYLIGVLKRL